MIVRTMSSLFAALMLSFVALVGQLAAQEEATPTPRPPALSDLTQIDQFQQRFDEQAGKPRLILLISPT